MAESKVPIPVGCHAAKQYFDGTHRQCPPCETLARLQPLFPRLGITRLANVTGLDTIGIPVVMACRPNSRSLSVSQGKGLNLDAAKVSAAMESIEAYHAERIVLPLKLASYEQLRAGHTVVDVGLLPRSPDSHFHAHLPLLWVEGDDWLQAEKVWVPFQLVHAAYTTAMRFDLTSFSATSTGLASGNHLLEAVSHALCEVVERDADLRFTLLPAEEQESLRVDLDTVDHPQCRELLDRCRRAGVDVAAWDITSRVGLAAFSCHIVGQEDEPARRLYPAAGSGCHPARHIAFLRALTEAVQSRLTAISGSRDDMPRRDYGTWQDPANLAAHRGHIAGPGSRPFSATPSFEADAFEDDVGWELALLRKAGYLRAVVLDLTLPEFRIPVVRALVPGMEFSGGRKPSEAFW